MPVLFSLADGPGGRAAYLFCTYPHTYTEREDWLVVGPQDYRGMYGKTLISNVFFFFFNYLMCPKCSLWSQQFQTTFQGSSNHLEAMGFFFFVFCVVLNFENKTFWCSSSLGYYCSLNKMRNLLSHSIRKRRGKTHAGSNRAKRHLLLTLEGKREKTKREL